MKKKMLPKLQRSQQAVVTRLICAWAMELTAEKIKALCSWISPPNPTNSVRDVCLRTLLGLSKDAHDNRKLPSSLKTRVEPLCSQQTVLPTPVRVQPVRRGRPRAATGAPGWLPGKLGWLEHYSSLRNLHLPLAPPHPLLRTTARFSVFDKVLRKVSFRSPLPTGFTPTSLTWTTDEDDSFQRTTVERPTVTSCGRKEARLRFRPPVPACEVLQSVTRAAGTWERLPCISEEKHSICTKKEPFCQPGPGMTDTLDATFLERVAFLQ